jgi:hypothetical protein
MTPARISPMIDGWPIRLKTSSPTLAARRMTKRSVTTSATSVLAAIGSRGKTFQGRRSCLPTSLPGSPGIQAIERND